MPREIKSLTDANIAIKDLQDSVNKFTANIVDFKGRRIINAADAIDAQDYVTKNNLDNYFRAIDEKLRNLKAELDFLEIRVRKLEP